MTTSPNDHPESKLSPSKIASPQASANHCPKAWCAYSRPPTAATFFAGEARMSDKPVNLPVELDRGDGARSRPRRSTSTASDPKKLRDAKLAERADVELRAFNAKGVPVTLEIRQYRR